MSTISRRLAGTGRRDGSGSTPGLSIVLAVYDPPMDALRIQLDAIADQTSDDFECVVVDDASTRPEVLDLLRMWVDLAPRRRRLVARPTNGGIAAATNDGIDAASGAAVMVCDHDDIVHATAVEAVLSHFEEHPDHDVVYTDEQLIDADGAVLAVYRKPDYSPRRHLGHHYLAHLVAARRDAIGELRVRQAYEPSQDYDFYLRVIERATERGRGVGHIPEILYSWRAIAGSSALDAGEKPEMVDAVRRCSQAALDRRGITATARTATLDGAPTTSVQLVPPPDAPSPTIGLVAIDDSTTPDEVNAAVALLDATVIVLTTDTTAFGTEWAEPLAIEATRDDVGVVGPVVADDDGRLLSAGRVVRHTLIDRFAGESVDSPGPWGAFLVAREVTAVAPQGATVERTAFDDMGGLATDVGLDVAVAELGVRLAATGRATLWTPAVTLRLDRSAALLDTDTQVDTDIDTDVLRAAARTPDLADEHYDLMGLDVLDLDEPDPHGRADVLLRAGRVDLVTSDVFDTVVTRPVATPSDVFVRLAAELDLPPHVTPLVFAGARREAESQARRRHADGSRNRLRADDPTSTAAEIAVHPEVAAPECTLDEIWNEMPHEWLDPAIGSRAELALEARVLQPIPETIEVFRTAHARGVPVVLVSDIYLTGAQLAGLLGDAGVDMGLVSSVVTSADRRLGKAHGLLAEVIADHGVEPARVIHLGDNEVADVRTATELGAEAIHVDVAEGSSHVDLPSDPVAAWSSASGSDLGITAAVRSTLLASGPLRHDPSYQFGAAVAGPVIAGFSRWVATTTADLGASHVHCLLREGATIAEMLAITAPTGPTPVPLHVSRWVTMRAAVIDATPDELLTALARRADLDVDHVVRAFGCDPGQVRDVLGGDRVPAGEVLDACTALAADDDIRATIVSSAAELRARVMRYLDQRLVLDDTGPLVVADVGWGGTIQEGLTRILRSAGVEGEVVGLYLALSAPGEQRLRRGARMLSYLPNESDDAEQARHSRAIAHHADTIERIMTPEIGTLVDIADDGSPVCRDAADDPIPPTLASAQRALRAVAVRLADTSLGLSDFDDPHWTADTGLRAAFARVLADAITSPSRPLAEALGAWPHDDVAGTGHRSIAGAELGTAVRYANVRDVDLLDPAGRSWVAGLAGAHNPVLAGQLAAAQLGVPLDILAPESENGVARLAAFELGSDLAAVQVGRAVAVAPAGWSVLHLRGDLESLRSIRFDAGEHDALVDIGHFSIRLTTADGHALPLRHVTLDDADLIWIRSHPLDSHRYAQQAGGHLLVDVEAERGARIRSIDVTVAFRSWRLHDDHSLVDTPLRRRIGEQQRRVRSAVRRRLG